MKKPDRFLKERGFATVKELPKGPNGRPLCRQCNTETEPPRKSFCSDACVHEWRIRSNGNYAREQVFKRDRGVCKACGLDTEALRALLYRVRSERGGAAYEGLLAYYEKKTGYRFDLDKHAWEADHLRSVADGGGSCSLNNYVSLCVPCHRRKTKEWYRAKWKRKAKARKRSRKW